MVTGRIRLLFVVMGLCFLTACGNTRASIATLTLENRGTGNLHQVALAQGTTASLAADTTTVPSDKLIALTFDDGPRPYVLFGTKGEHAAPGLVDILDQNGVKATFFVVGWRLTPKTWGDFRHEQNVGITCIDAAAQLIKHGHELEDHTFSHVELRTAERKKGEQWVIGDVDHGAEAIKAITGTQPRYVRPPDWIITDDARRDLERHGYRLLTISSENPVALRDINSLDYLCAGRAVGCPKPSLEDSVAKQIEQREKHGIYTHILAFHELSTTTAIMPKLIEDLKSKGYRFVTLTEYMSLVTPKRMALAK